MQAIQQACFLWFCSHLLSSSCTCLYERSDYHGEVSQHKADGLQLSFIPLRDIWKWIQIVTYSRVIRVPRIDWFLSCVCLRKGSRKKKKEAAGISYTTSVSPSQDTEGSEINLAAAPKIEHGPPLEQDADCVGTGRGHCGQQSYFCCATGPLGVDAHSFIRLPASRLGDTRRDTHALKKYTLHALPVDHQQECDMLYLVKFTVKVSELPLLFFFVTRGYLCLFLPIWVYLYVSCLLVFELKDDGNTPGSRWPHVSDTVSLCLSLLPLLEAQHILAMLLDRTSSLILLLFSPYRWFTLARRHECSLFATAKTSTQTKGKWMKMPAEWFLTVSFSFLCSFLCLPLIRQHAHTHKYTHINSPLGVCCFHYLQLGPETAFRVEYSRAELARIAVYIERGVW